MTVMTEMCKDGLRGNKNKSSFVDMSKKYKNYNINNMKSCVKHQDIPPLSGFAQEAKDYIKTDEIYFQEIELVKRITYISDEQWRMFKEISHMFRIDRITKSEYIRAMDVLCVKM